MARLGEEFILIEDDRYKLNPAIFGETSYEGEHIDDITVDKKEMANRGFYFIGYSFRGKDEKEAKRLIEIAKQNGIYANYEYAGHGIFVDLEFPFKKLFTKCKMCDIIDL